MQVMCGHLGYAAFSIRYQVSHTAILKQSILVCRKRHLFQALLDCGEYFTVCPNRTTVICGYSSLAGIAMYLFEWQFVVQKSRNHILLSIFCLGYALAGQPPNILNTGSRHCSLLPNIELHVGRIEPIEFTVDFPKNVFLRTQVSRRH